MIGRIHSIETMGMLDGPGIRTIFFLQGCPLRCIYCHNPDSQRYDSGQQMTAEQIVAMALKYKEYYDASGGGVTFSGGEPLVQGPFLIEAMKGLKASGIHIALDTSGYGQVESYEQVLALADMILLDVKHFDEQLHRKMIGVSMKGLDIFLKKLKKFKGRLWVRHVMIPGYTDNSYSVDQLFERIKPVAHKVEKIEILPFHQLGIDKYRELGLDYKLKETPEMGVDIARGFEIYINQKLKNYIAQRVGDEHYFLSQAPNEVCSM